MPQCCKYKFKPSNANIYNAQVFLRRKSINWWPKIRTKNHVWLKNIFKFQRIFHVQTLAAGKNLNKLVHSFIVIWIWFWIISQLQIMKNWSLIVFSQKYFSWQIAKKYLMMYFCKSFDFFHCAADGWEYGSNICIITTKTRLNDYNLGNYRRKSLFN